ncbi:XTP/dITP diphosphatase [Oceanobacillus senegalensis]|uniref:XTP/dITP diphosphatase n=1 Tax=Oceanobacillus senegalensis TaxID=1936063 RepID=UPI000A306ED1|nr:XTP/dITP diphosphatase [Oceanobacillus senegalensis]
MKQIVIATRNNGKAKEFKSFFLKYEVEAISLLDINDDLPDVEETGDSFEENAALKAEEISRILDLPVVADDSGLEIDALDGRPGIYSARYAGEKKDDKANMYKVLEEMRIVSETKRTARFVCVLAIAIPRNKTVFKRGICEGTIAFSEAGKNGFGYDPIFIPNGYEKTMAEIDPEEKNKISHRKKAMDQLEKWLGNL